MDASLSTDNQNQNQMKIFILKNKKWHEGTARLLSHDSKYLLVGGRFPDGSDDVNPNFLFTICESSAPIYMKTIHVRWISLEKSHRRRNLSCQKR
jgi:hypothetical protein